MNAFCLQNDTDSPWCEENAISWKAQLANQPDSAQPASNEDMEAKYGAKTGYWVSGLDLSSRWPMLPDIKGHALRSMSFFSNPTNPLQLPIAHRPLRPSVSG